jgi:DNA replication protein DnaC
VNDSAGLTGFAHLLWSIAPHKMDSALNRPVEDWGKLLSDVAAVSAMLDRMLHHGHVLKCGPRSWRTKSAVGGS